MFAVRNRFILPLLLVAFLQFPQPAAAQYAPVGTLHGPVPLLHVIDGDTIVLWSNLGPRTVRMIGIDAPELDRSDPFGVAAADFLRAHISLGTMVWVETDLSLVDIYGRLLGYVYIEDPDGDFSIGPLSATQLNLKMMESGWARTLHIAPNSTWSDLYAEAEQRAAEAGLGMWATTGSQPGEILPAGPVTIACVLYNPDTLNDENAEIVYLHLDQDYDTRGYWLFDEGSGVRLPLPLGVQPAGELEILNPGQGIWNNSGDTIYLMRGDSLVDSWTYVGGHPQDTVLCRDGSSR